MKTESILATTHIDRRNERLPKQALDDIAFHINKDESAILYTIEHDSTIPPIGKVLRAEVQKREDGEYQVAAIQEIFDEIEWITHRNRGKTF